MSKEFEMSDLSRLSSRNHQRNEYIELKQTSYAKKVLKKAGMAACNPTIQWNQKYTSTKMIWGRQ